MSSVFQYDSDDVDSHDGVMADAGEGRNASGKRTQASYCGLSKWSFLKKRVVGLGSQKNSLHTEQKRRQEGC